jgi:hypothetical protein
MQFYAYRAAQTTPNVIGTILGSRVCRFGA